MTGNANAFRENGIEMMTPTLPADVNGYSLTAPTLSGHFARVAEAKQNQVQMAAVPVGPQPVDGPRLVNDAIGVGITLQNPAQGIHVQMPKSQSAFGEFGGQMAKMGAEVGGAAYKLGGEMLQGIFGILGDSDGNGIPPAQENPDPALAPRPQPLQMGMPSPSSGMGGM